VHLFTSLNEFLAKSLSGFVKVSDRSMLGLLLLNHNGFCQALSSPTVAFNARLAWPSLFSIFFCENQVQNRRLLKIHGNDRTESSRSTLWIPQAKISVLDLFGFFFEQVLTSRPLS